MRAGKIAPVVVAVVVLAVVGIVVFLWPMIYGVLHNPFDEERFDRAKWLAAGSAADAKNPRGPMAEDLRRRFLPKGMGKADVRTLLGAPYNSQWAEEHNQDCYILGAWGYMPIDPSILIIYYDESGKIMRTKIGEM